MTEPLHRQLIAQLEADRAAHLAGFDKTDVEELRLISSAYASAQLHAIVHAITLFEGVDAAMQYQRDHADGKHLIWHEPEPADPLAEEFAATGRALARAGARPNPAATEATDSVDAIRERVLAVTAELRAQVAEHERGADGKLPMDHPMALWCDTVNNIASRIEQALRTPTPARGIPCRTTPNNPLASSDTADNSGEGT